MNKKIETLLIVCLYIVRMILLIKRLQWVCFNYCFCLLTLIVLILLLLIITIVANDLKNLSSLMKINIF